jgi:alkylation response protein AidB-like acyl-CoA dehydrogenase
VHLGLTDEQQELVRSFANLLSKASSIDEVRAVEPGGFDRALWSTLGEHGAVIMAVAESGGGWGASLEDLVLVAEQVGRALASAPVVETQVSARLLSRIASVPARRVLDSVLHGDRIVTLALHRPVAAVARLVPAGAVCDTLVCFDGQRLGLVDVTSESRRPVANLGDAPLADISLAQCTDLPSSDAEQCFEQAIDEWLLLTASALVGMSAAAHEMVCAYAAERRAFGGVIGSYQGVAHPLADDATSIDGARLLAQKAAWALDTGHPRGAELAAMAFAFASETAERATYDAIHFLGGYGFMLEHDAQLYYRRARGWARVWGNADAAYRRAAAARYGSTPGNRSP